MKKIIILLALSVFILSSCVKKYQIADTSVIDERVEAEMREIWNYQIADLADDAETVDIRIKPDEKLMDLVVYTDKSRVVEVLFKSDGKLSRVYNLVFSEGEKLISWDKKGIKTSKRFVKINWIQE